MRTISLILPLLLAFLPLFANQSLAEEKAIKGEPKMDRVKMMEKNRAKLLGQNGAADSVIADPELGDIHDRLFFGEIAEKGTLDDKKRELVSIAALAAAQAEKALKTHVRAALNVGAAPAEIREVLYQIAPYIGLPRSDAAIALANEVFGGQELRTPAQATVNEESRFREGLAVQKKIFGAANIEKMQANAPAGQKEIMTNYLSAFCFGDFYTRKGLDLKMRELVTFSAIVALGGCDPQARAHAAANISVGNSKQNLVDALAAMLPYIGFPRTLNGLAAVNAAVPEE